VNGVLARTSRRVLAAELGIYLALGAWLVASRGWTTSGAVLLAFGVAAALRVGFGLATYALAWWWRNPVPAPFRVGPLRFAAHVGAELGAMLTIYTVYHPFERAWMGPVRPERFSRERLPVILVHGYVCNRAQWRPIARALRARGETVWAASYEPVYASIERSVPQLAGQIDAALAASGRDRAILVAHSMGGLVVRAYLRAHGGGKVARAVTLGSPHHGSMHAHLGAGENAREMEPGSAWLAALAADERAGVAAPLVAIYSHHDNFVAPQDSAAHPHARNIPLPGVGHLAMHFSRPVRELLLREIDDANASEP
jgi:pimeloyl-ACP methyl ester carboxylesterase